MLNLNTREKKMILLAVLVVSVAIIYKFFVTPYMEKWKTVNSMISQTQTRLTRAKQLKDNPQDLYAHDTIQNQTSTVARLLENLESWSVESNVKIVSVKPGPVQDKGNVRELNFDVEINGELEPICRMVQLIENPKVITRINKVRISKPKDILQDLTVVLTVSTLSLLEPTASKKASVPKTE